VEFAKKIVETTEEIFNTMIFMDISAEDPLAQGKQDLGCHLSSMIGLSGGFSAMLSIHCPEPIGLAIAGAMLAISPRASLTSASTSSMYIPSIAPAIASPISSGQ
jgi:chemotaxis protein CheX